MSPLHRHCLRLIYPFLLVSFLLAPPALCAEETIAAYPPLPAGYSSIRVYDRNNHFVGRIMPEGRQWVTLERIPLFLRNALLAIEDSRFYSHGGIDLRGIARALVKDVAQGRLAEGGSTITQQLVKNKHLSAEKTIDRKVREGILAMEYEKKYSKDQILEMYFNEIYFGNGAWGIAQAARLYFDKNPEELSDAESALLAGIPKNPSRYNPLAKGGGAEERKRTVLRRMAELKLISPQREEALRRQPVIPTPGNQAGEYLAHVRRKLVDRYGAQIVEAGGLTVTASLDLPLQLLAEKTVREGLKTLTPGLQGALLAVDPLTGDILAMAGGTDFPQNSFNRALFAERQPGSTIKPLIYADALTLGITPASRWDDSPVSYNRGNGHTWTPRNYNGEVNGELSLHEALVRSNNVVTVKLLDTIGVGSFVDFARNLGLRVTSPGDLSLGLGTGEVTLHDLTFAYTPFAGGGLRPETRTIISVYDRNRGFRDDNPPELTEVLDPAAAYITTRMLQDVLTIGTAKGLKSFAASRPAAGKTGTTDDYRDAWFIGYTPQLVAGVWVGHDRPQPEGRGFTGGAVAAPLWERFMRGALAGRPAEDFIQPEGVVSVVIDPLLGCQTDLSDPAGRIEYFYSGSEPLTYCPEPGPPRPETAPPRPAISE